MKQNCTSMVDIKFFDAELHLDELNTVSRFDTINNIQVRKLKMFYRSNKILMSTLFEVSSHLFCNF